MPCSAIWPITAFLPFTLQQFAGSGEKKQKPLPGGNSTEHKAENFLGVTPAPGPV